MLRLFTGAAGTGKTRRVMEEIKDAAQRGRGGRILVVPEQYSHEAERELCRVCGGGMSLFAEVLSFTGMARKFAGRRNAAVALDKGGQLLCMALALDGISTRLEVYGDAVRKPELQKLLLDAVSQMKGACLSSEALFEASEKLGGGLGGKLRDLGMIYEAYDAVIAQGRIDPADRLTRLAETVLEQGTGLGLTVYFDGFIDFTAQERAVIRALMSTGAEITVCLTWDRGEDNEAFVLSERAGRRLISDAGELGILTEETVFDESAEGSEQLRFLSKNLLSYKKAQYRGEGGAVSLFRGDSIFEECAAAAARCVELCRDEGARWRDIAVAVRGFEEYRLPLMSAFSHYGAPLFAARKADLLSKPIPALIRGAYEVIYGGWSAEDVTEYLRTGLAGLEPEEVDELENYLLMWGIGGSLWTGEKPWRQHPEGYGREYTDETFLKLDRIAELRRRVYLPLKKLAESSSGRQTAGGQALALWEFFEDIELPRRLSDRSGQLRGQGNETLAAEYEQLWELVVTALEQAAAVLGEASMDGETFSRLITLILSQYDVGVIPVSLDRVTAGDFDRMRRRNIEHLIVLGASDDRIPGVHESAGMFSDEERRLLLEMELDLGSGGETELYREFSLIYNTLTLPKKSLYMSYRGGEGMRPAFVMNRARELFGLELLQIDGDLIKTDAPGPAAELAARGLRGGGRLQTAGAAVMGKRWPEKLSKLLNAARLSRGSLSEKGVRTLYGKNLRLSASRIDRFSNCRFSYFLQYGLKARPRKPAGFDAPEMGVFMHFVLQNTARAVQEKGGFQKVSDQELGEICDGFIGQYVREELNDFGEKTNRFRYLFNRLCGDVRRVVADMAGEMRKSDFVPLDFELDFGRDKRLPPVAIGQGEDRLELTGIADRVDGWVHGGKLYLRVIDYKTGRKKFELSDVWYGMGLQMLLYLFALEKNGDRLYGREIVPAGVLYVPARDVLLSSPTELSGEEAAKKRGETLRRSGLILNEPEVINAMEHGEETSYIPVKFKGGAPEGDALATANELGILSRHIENTLKDMAGELRRGSIAADPFYRSQQENACLNCDFFDACHFDEGQEGDRIKYEPRLKPAVVWELLKGGGENG